MAEAEAVIAALWAATLTKDPVALIKAVIRDHHFLHFVLAGHGDFRVSVNRSVGLKRDMPAIAARLIVLVHYRRDLVMRSSVFVDDAFLWSDIAQIVRLGRRERDGLALGTGEGPSDRILLPYAPLGTSSGIDPPESKCKGQTAL